MAYNKRFFKEHGGIGGRKGMRLLTAAQRRAKARKAGLASAAAKRKGKQ